MLFWIILFIVAGTLIKIAGEKSQSSFIHDIGRLLLILATILTFLVLFIWFVDNVIF